MTSIEFPGCLPERVVLAIVSFFGSMNVFLVRFSFSIISISMAKPHFNCNSTENCTIDLKEEVITFDWDERTRAIMLSSFTYGYCLTQIVGGRLAELYGGKIVFGSAVVIPAVLGLLIPKGAEISYWVVATIRFFQGFFQGASWPSMYAMITVWIPPVDRSKYIGIIAMSASLSIVWTMPLSGYLCDVLNWQWAFYIVSIIPIIWGIFWITLVYKTPGSHPRISKKEQKYIEKSVQERGTSKDRSKSVPWKSVFTSVPFLAVVILDISNGVAFSLYLNQMPNFLKSNFNFKLTKTGILAGLPFLCRYIGSTFFSILADYIIKKKLLKISTTRRIFSVVALIIPAIILAMNVGFGLYNVKSFIIFSCFYMFFNGSIAPSGFANFSDFAPNYCGTLYGISNTLTGVSDFIAVLISGEILNPYTNSPSFTPWRIIFGSCVPLMIGADVFFLIFMRASPLPWNFHQQEKQEELTELT